MQMNVLESVYAKDYLWYVIYILLKFKMYIIIFVYIRAD